VPIDVDDTQPVDTMVKAGHRADTDGAVATKDHNRVLGWSGSDQRGDLAGAVDDRAGVGCPRVVGVRPPSKRRHPPTAVRCHTSRP
jgi:hypothetical protein